MKRIAVLISIAVIIVLSLIAARDAAAPHFLTQQLPQPKTQLWDLQSIDTMKYSRDLAQAKLNDSSFDAVIDEQIGSIAETGVNYVAIGTPYDEEFLPILKRWVASARRHNLSVWFRGNWSGWEQWFNYPRISSAMHIAKTEQFILKHPELFEDGDIFTACPECENGGDGDPRTTGKTRQYRTFLISLDKATKKSFETINKKVITSVYSMNGDVAELIMDSATTKALGNNITIDHYASSPEQLQNDLTSLQKKTSGSIVIGEFGGPIPDLHGELTEAQQADWLAQSLDVLAKNEAIIGLNYWTSVGGSTALWRDNGTARKAVAILEAYYNPESLYGMATDEAGAPIPNVLVETTYRKIRTTNFGYYELPFVVGHNTSIKVSAPGYISQSIELTKPNGQFDIVLKK